jgi:hypothetical protein
MKLHANTQHLGVEFLCVELNANEWKSIFQVICITFAIGAWKVRRPKRALFQPVNLVMRRSFPSLNLLLSVKERVKKTYNSDSDVFEN